MTWEIVIGIITLVGAVISVGTIIFKLSSTLTKLQSTLDALNNILTELKKSNKDDHETFFDSIDDLKRRVQAIEIKIDICGTGV